MRKFYTLFFFLTVLLTQKNFGQVSQLNYPSPMKFNTGSPVTPVQNQAKSTSLSSSIYSKTFTIAGNGLYGSKDTLAAFATMEGPTSLAYDSKGNLFFIDANLNSVREISLQGVVSTLAGGGPKGYADGKGTSAKFSFPTGIAIDKSDNIYVADFGNSMIRKVTPDGTVSTFAGSPLAGFNDGQGMLASFELPYGIAFDLQGNLLVADSYNHRIRKITPDGTVSTIAGSGKPGHIEGNGKSASFNVPYNLAVDKLGNIYVADQSNNCIRKITPAYQVSTFATLGSSLPVGVAVDNKGMVYVSGQRDFNIKQLGPDGKPTTTFPFSGSTVIGKVNGTDTLARYNSNLGLLFDPRNNELLVADDYNDLIRKVSLTGFAASPLLPPGLRIDSTGTISGTPVTTGSASKYVIYNHTPLADYTDTVSIEVDKGNSVINFPKLGKSTYGDSDFNITATSSNPQTPITFTSSDETVATIVNNNQLHIVRAGPVTLTASQAGNSNFNAAASVSQAYQINQAVISVYVDNKYKTKGQANPAFTANYYGFVKGQDTTVFTTMPKFTAAVDTGTAPGKYPITASGGTADNYSFNYVNGTLTVFPLPVISYNGSTTILKGDSILLTVSPSSGYTYTWALNGKNIPGATNSTYWAKETGYYTVAITAEGYNAFSLAVPIQVELQLPQDNFQLTVNSLSCKGSANGSISVKAKQALSYTATLTGVGTPYHFTDSLTVSNLTAGSYTLCISVDNEIFQQCYQLNVSEPQDLSVYATVDNVKNSVTLQMNGGINYSIKLNDQTYTTTQNVITLPLVQGVNNLLVTTDRLCQGVIQRVINLSKDVKPYPNPFQSILNVNLGSSNVQNIQLSVVNTVDGKTVYTNHYTNQSGVLQFDLSGLTSGVYYLNMNLDDKTSGYKIIKR